MILNAKEQLYEARLDYFFLFFFAKKKKDSTMEIDDLTYLALIGMNSHYDRVHL